MMRLSVRILVSWEIIISGLESSFSKDSQFFFVEPARRIAVFFL